MKNSIILSLLFCLLFSWISAQTETKQKKKLKRKHSTEKSTPAVAKRTISGKVTQSSQYCGGAEPDPEILQQMNAKQKYAGKKFYIRKDTLNSSKKPIELSFTSDANGNFSFQLPPGTYMILLEEQIKEPDVKKYNSPSQNVNEKCLTDWWKKPYYVLVIGDKDITGLDFHFYHRCFINTDIPCLSYIGPMPP